MAARSPGAFAGLCHLTNDWTMTLLLAGVTGPTEAEAALARGADIIDLRGDATPESLREVLAAVAGRRAVSAGTGDVTQLAPLTDTGIDYLKVLTRSDEDTIRAAAPLAQRASLFAIVLAEDAFDEAAIKAMAASGFAGMILNTSGGRNLLEALDITTLGRFADTARRHGLAFGLAGALEPPDIPRLLLLEPDILAFRFEAATFDGIRAQIPPDQRRRARTAAKVDYRLARPPEG